MNQERSNLVTDHPDSDGHKFDLQRAYEIMIRSYMRRYRLRKTMVHPAAGEVNHGQ